MTPRRTQTLLDYLYTGVLYLPMQSRMYVLKPPTPDIMQYMKTAYYTTLHSQRFHQWFTVEQCQQLLIRRGLIPKNYKAVLKELVKTISDMKVDLYLSYFRTGSLRRIYNQLKVARQKYQDMTAKLSHLNCFTLENRAIQQSFIVCLKHCLYYDNQLVFSDISQIPHVVFNYLLITKERLEPTETEVRHMAKTQPFRSAWTVSHGNLFRNRQYTQLLPSQQLAVTFSKMYDNIAESLDRPSDDIVQNDDMCDGWLIWTGRKQEKAQKQKQVENIYGNHKHKHNHNEIFLPARNTQDIERINALNDTGARVVMQQRQAQIQRHGKVKESQLPDQKLARTQLQTQQFKGNRN